MTDPNIFLLRYNGLIAADAEPDEGECPRILRVDGRDLIGEVAAAMHDLRAPVTGYVTVKIDGEYLSKREALRATPAYYDDYCADGCCGGEGRGELTVGDLDLAALLASHHGSTARVSITGRGYRPPDVQVTLAHHTRWGKPRDTITVNLDVAKSLARGRRLVKRDNERLTQA